MHRTNRVLTWVAGGLLGVEAAINSPADGYTLVMASYSVLLIAPLMARKPSMMSTVTPISVLSTVPMVIVAKEGGRFTDMRQVLAEARAAPLPAGPRRRERSDGV